MVLLTEEKLKIEAVDRELVGAFIIREKKDDLPS